jgi:hypothetical protein
MEVGVLTSSPLPNPSRHDITEILLKVALDTIKQPNPTCELSENQQPLPL